MYRKRFGIETSYRQMHEARIKTCTRNPKLRLLFIGIALVLRNVWVWLHFKLDRVAVKCGGIRSVESSFRIRFH